MKNKKKWIYISVISFLGLLMIFSGIMIVIVSKKYDDVEILSIRKEYNLVLAEKSETVDIPLYFERTDTFLVRKSQIDSCMIYNESYSFKGSIDEVEEGSSVSYNKSKYKEFIFKINFSSYDDFKDPVFISMANLKITYKNGNEISLPIGNMNIYFNSKAFDKTDLLFTKLQAVTNIVSGKETIVGLNMVIMNNTDESIKINDIRIKNKFYDLDYMHFESSLLDSTLNLSERENDYSYEAYMIDSGDMSFQISPNERKSLFIPIKYINGILTVDSLPLYITYTMNEEEFRFVQDDFTFVKFMSINDYNGISRYVYHYN